MQALGPIAMGTGILGKVAEGAAYDSQGRFNQAIGDRNALDAERDASASAADTREQSRKAIGAQLVAQAGSGFQMGTGSPLDALFESQVNGVLDAMTLRRTGATRAQSYRLGGTVARMEGDQRARAAYAGAAQAAVESVSNYAAAGG